MEDERAVPAKGSVPELTPKLTSEASADPNNSTYDSRLQQGADGTEDGHAAASSGDQKRTPEQAD